MKAESRPIASFVVFLAFLQMALASSSNAQLPDPVQSFFVPEAGSVASPIVGNQALATFRVCPNNDAATNNARIKIFARDVDGIGIPGISPADICILFNGGTVAQGFPGVGADSIIANTRWNAICPDVRCVQADAPTDANGVTYITFVGSTPGSPGVATRDPQRKWGHYDSDIPVFVLGVAISGRITQAAANGSYILRIKNFDVSGGLVALPFGGEIVNLPDINVFTAAFDPATTSPFEYWVDFNNDGFLAVSDINQFTVHIGHDCNTPRDP